jgi:hypothetical protein
MKPRLGTDQRRPNDCSCVTALRWLETTQLAPRESPEDGGPRRGSIPFRVTSPSSAKRSGDSTM